MGEWKECKISDIAKLSKKSWKVGDEPMSYIGLEHIEEAKLRLNGIGKSEDVASNKFYFQAGDTLFGKLRPYFRKVVKPNFDGICSTDIWVINPQKGIDKDFLFYFFTNQELVDISYSSSGGTRMPRADWNFLSQTVWNVPPLEEQKAIAEVLSSLDDKIDLLHRQNKTLEELAQTLFRQWFIEEARDEWEVTILGNLGKAVTGKTPSTQNTEFWGDGIYFVTPTDFKYYGKYTTFSDRSLSLLGVEKVKNSLLPINSILVTCIGSDMGKVAIAQSQCVSNQQINSLIIEDSILVEYVYQHLKYIYPLLRAIAMGGTTMPIINKTDFENIEITLPTYDLIEKFHEVTSSFNEKIIQNTNQIKNLKNMRETLLPKLMGGEVRVEW
ncbi:restriction endonuclease subunit S [Sulfuricurvum sp.]|uniref:restriction endonuclease subunit S n=1 Tax=Sulfuricurvum sp. TaxID=2025608 RepID=UPI00260D554E|nr:restriction endonuclease subunit S [Sulfuricurvum sp.]MDD2267682.1 restriction endonuclease subunit S [Sulfuricurvum sp.]MDD2784119.1 restriction endonuclease subunit S [Sulfuricurvum sp.]